MRMPPLSPDAAPLPRHCHRQGLCGPQTVCLVSFELRSSAVKETLVREASKAFGRVERLSKAALPKRYQVEHIELYRLQV